MAKPYKARTLAGAQTRVRQLLKIVDEYERLCRRYSRERKQLAMLAAEGPAYHNPLEVMAAERLRDEILAIECKRNPDGSSLTCSLAPSP